MSETLTPELIKDRVELELDKARQNFWAFRLAIHPEMITSWWPQEIARHLQIFYDDLIAGKRPKMIIAAPPQHGKSMAAADFIAWIAGKNPDLKTIFAAYADALGERTSRDLVRVLNSETYIKISGRTRIGLPGWKMTTELIEYSDYRGSFRYTTSLGSVTGLELHLGVIDDPVKGRQEAFSKQIRDRTWHWFTDDFMTRFNKDAGLLTIATRWHVDDLLGRLIDHFPDANVLRYPAVAEEDSKFRKAGQPLFEEWKPLDFLLNQKRAMSQASWEALYQQSPITVGGGQLPIDKVQYLQKALTNEDVIATVRFWDKAGTVSETAAWTAGVLMHKMKDNRIAITHVARGKWTALDREQQIKTWTENDANTWRTYQVGVEQEPGSGGKESAEATVRNLMGYRVFVDKVTGKKEIRAEPFCAQVQGGNLFVAGGPWVQLLLDEFEVWPQGTKDQVDACSGAFNHLSKAIGGNSFIV
jgi:predicted phage terminase large subunit-like protein